MKNNINPNKLKGNDNIERMRSLMNIKPINENTSHSVIELTKLGPDGKVYGIVRENHKYFIKTSVNKTEKLVAEDFNYIGGLKNKNEVVFESYAKAIKQLNLKFISINEALGSVSSLNTFKNDNLDEAWESYSEAPKPSQPDSLMGTVKSIGKNDGHDTEIINDAGDTGGDGKTPPVVEEDEDLAEGEEVVEEGEVELTESERLIDKMINETKDAPVEIKGGKLSILTALGKINEGATSKKKV